MAAPAADDKAGAEDGAVREQDKFLPIANISRIMKEGLPQNAKISKDAKELVQQCVSDFIIFVTSEASDKCQREKRKTVNGDDILWAMKSLGFEDAVVVLTTYLQKIREAEGVEKQAKSAIAADNRDSQTGSAAIAATTPAAPSMMPMGTPGGHYTVAYAPVQMQGQQGASVPGQNMQPSMFMFMPMGGTGQQPMQMVSMPIAMQSQQPMQPGQQMQPPQQHQPPI